MVGRRACFMILIKSVFGSDPSTIIRPPSLRHGCTVVAQMGAVVRGVVVDSLYVFLDLPRCFDVFVVFVSGAVGFDWLPDGPEFGSNPPGLVFR